MNDEKRSIEINILPKSEGAWDHISTIGVWVAVAIIFCSFSSCQARETEARYKAQSTEQSK